MSEITYTNNGNIALSVALWLAHEKYDHDDDPKTISATTLLKPIRSIVLGIQNKQLDKHGDISSKIPSGLGTAIHESIELAWTDLPTVKKLMKQLQIPDNVVDRVLINPKPEELKEDTIAVYMEQRAYKEICGFRVSGKFDFVINGKLEDFKSTGTYNFINGSNKDQYRKQGSIYRWLNPDIITDSIIDIQYIFTDWSKLQAMKDKAYPQMRLVTQSLPLMTVEETEQMVTAVLNRVNSLLDKPQADLPLCTKEELWQTDPVYKYYKDPSKTARATKNFDNLADANDRLVKDGSVGIVKTIHGQVKRCPYCNVVEICEQAIQLRQSGLLIL